MGLEIYTHAVLWQCIIMCQNGKYPRWISQICPIKLDSSQLQKEHNPTVTNVNTDFLYSDIQCWRGFIFPPFFPFNIAKKQ